ncbi:DcrB-related protein [Pseudomonas huanghezhanensis]|uniref:DcrB-related protein n=1 Tax=Pseudomonas huanghezhanensis TaxID=3002903 RepID=UPI0022854017|nr:DcrB-related protein [Pseudomonas sp. BSw22131]
MPDAPSYRINECRFNLPHADVQDASINILKFAELGTSLIVSRSVLGESETLRSNFDAQLERLQQQVQALRFEPVQTLSVGTQNNIEALELRSEFNKGDARVFQYQLTFLVPGTRQMQALSYVKAEPLGDEESMHWETIKASLQFEATR